jgi:hypothetical protein
MGSLVHTEKNTGEDCEYHDMSGLANIFPTLSHRFPNFPANWIDVAV